MRTRNLPAIAAVVLLLLLWQAVCTLGLVPAFMLPSPIQVVNAFCEDLPLLCSHAAITLQEAMWGLFGGIALGFLAAVVMDRSDFLYYAIYPILVLTQTVPTVAIAPLLVLWFGYETTPKIILIVISTFFPITVGMLDGFRSADKDAIGLLRSMGANRWQIFRYIKFPSSLPQLFSGLRIAAAYSIVGAVISEWLGGFGGLGVYMTRVKKAFAFDKMFAVIFLISGISLGLIALVEWLEKKCMPYRHLSQIRKDKTFMKKIIGLLLSVSIVVMLFACGGPSAPTETITFVLDWTPNTNHTGVYVALEKGYFAEEGLNVQIVQPPEDGSTVLVAAGKAQFAVTAQDTIAPALAGDSPMPITAVAAILQHNTSGILSRKGEGMDSPKGMEEKCYATWDAPVEKATVSHVMKIDGGDFSKVKLIPSTVTDEVSALKSGSVDAIWVFYGWAGIACEIAGLSTDYFGFADIDPVLDFYTPIIVANNDWLSNNADTARAFLTALSRGYEYAVDNPKEAADILMQYAPELKSNADFIYRSQEYLSKEYIADGSQWGLIDPSRWTGYFHWLNENGLVDSHLKEDTGFTNDFLPR